MKFAVSFFSVLLLVISATLFVQYQVYSDEIEKSPIAFNYSQEIKVEYRDNQLYVHHQFTDLPETDVTIEWPANAQNVGCATASCDRLTADMRQLAESETAVQAVSYEVPVQGGLQSGKLMQGLFATLTQGAVQYTTVHISTDRSIAGQWVTGLPLVGQQSLSLINYAMFSGAGAVQELYWQQQGIAEQLQQPLLSIYSASPISAATQDVLATMPFLHTQHIALVEGASSDVAASGRIIFVKNLAEATLQQDVILTQVDGAYTFGDSPQWLKHVVATFLTGITYGDAKTQEIATTITAQLSDEQLIAWQTRLKELQGSPLSLTILDDELSTILGKYTRYLTMNGTTEGTYPFLYNEQRPLYVDDVKQERVHVLLKDGTVFYSAQALLEALGYSAAVGDHGYYVKNETRDFRFPNEPGFYVFNQRRYNTPLSPIVTIADEFYIEETWLQRLFVVQVKKSAERITIETTTEQ